MKRNVIVRILLRYAGTFLFVLVIAAGVQLLIKNYHSQERVDMMLAQMSEQSGMGAELTSDNLRQAMGMDKPWQPDLWPFDDVSLWKGAGSSSSSPAPSYSPSASSSSSSSSFSSSRSQDTDTIGLAAGGAKDIVNFRENIGNGYLPQPTDVTCEGLFYDYYFDTGMRQPCESLFCPSYAAAITRDPLSYRTEYYLSVGLNSGLKESDFARQKLNLVIVLDISSSMSEHIDEYYYDGNGGRNSKPYDILRESKMECAKESVISILSQLERDDRFAIVLFNADASLAAPMRTVRSRNMYDMEREVRDIRENGSTNLDAGIRMASGLFNDREYRDDYGYENRIIVVTDAQPNTGDVSSYGLFDDIRDYAQKRIYTTFIGIGVDFNSRLIELISKTKGANYYTVRSSEEFSERMEEEFDFMVTPLVFDLELSLESRGWRIERVFGSPQADLATGSLMSVSTLFPSKSSGGNNKGGLVLLKLRRLTSEPDSRIYLRTSYEDRNGRHGHAESVIRPDDGTPEYFDNTGIRKGILLTRYAALMQNWTADERRYLRDTGDRAPGIDETTGLTTEFTGWENWERQSVNLRVSRAYTELFRDFARYFEDEINAIGDYRLEQELKILNTLKNYR